MAEITSFTRGCVCGRDFTDLGAFTRHQKGCGKGKKRLADALIHAKEVFQRKKAKLTCSRTGLNDSGNSETRLLASSSESRGSLPPGPLSHSQRPEEDESSLTLRRSRHTNHRLLLGFCDVLPERLSTLPPPEILPDPSTARFPGMNPSSSSHEQSSVHVGKSTSLYSSFRKMLKTQMNKFGLFRIYDTDNPPRHDPEDPFSVENMSSPCATSVFSDLGPSDGPSYHPYPNESSMLLGDWYWNQGAQKSREGFRQLLGIVGDSSFSPASVSHTPWDAIDRQLGQNQFDGCLLEQLGDDEGWKCSAVTISVPFHTRSRDPGPKDYTVPGFYHRSLVSIIKEKITNPAHAQLFHFEPYELLWHPPHRDRAIKVHGELYTSAAFIEAHRTLQNSPPEPDCGLPRVVAALMFSSDATQLTNFGDTKLWPLYVYFGNESKYRRCQPTSHLCSHAAYFQVLPDEFKDFLVAHLGDKAHGAILTHCQREFFHEQWRLLLDEEFISAYRHGIVILCCDGIKRRFYPRVFTYSADYPEKILIATIRNLGMCPCPRCKLPMVDVPAMGTQQDMTRRQLLVRVDDDDRRNKVLDARRLIYERNYAVDSSQVQALLKDESLIPTVNAFSERLGLCIFAMLVVDLLHEFELGIWKAVLSHLLRMADSLKGSKLHELDTRYRQVPSFGRDTIRRFSKNASEMKRIAARDFEDLLQCSLPVFEGILPEPHNTTVLKLLYTLCQWHGFAKLRIHTDETLRLLDDITGCLGEGIRAFEADTCPAFHTKELKREANCRQRREARTRAQREATATHSAPSNPARKPKTFNLRTYKLHALGDYTTTIRMFGTTDSYSTQPGEREHRVGKSRYTRTSRKEFVRQIARIERRQARIRRIRQSRIGSAPFESVERDLDERYNVGKSQNRPVDLYSLTRNNLGDPALKHFVSKLKRHLLPRIKSIHMLASELRPNSMVPGLDGRYNTSMATPDHVLLKSNRIYQHSVFRVSYTTYDVRRNQDTFNSNSDHCNIMMLLAPGEGQEAVSHRFCYARVIGAYHANVQYIGPGLSDYNPRRLDFLHVRWFEWIAPDQKHEVGLDMLRFAPVNDEDAFGFVDPADILRGCHLIPAFAKGRPHPNRAVLSSMAKDCDDWNFYYVNRFVDRDMLLRYHWGLGIGHSYSHVRDSATDEAVIAEPNGWASQDSGQYSFSHDSHTIIPGTSSAHLSGFDDLENELSIADLDVLEWGLPHTEADSWHAKSGAEGVSGPARIRADSTSLTRPDGFGFGDLDPGFSFSDLEAVEWVVESQDEDEGDSESDDNSGDSAMDEMYGSDPGDNDIFD